jgi:hypothetical protein
LGRAEGQQRLAVEDAHPVSGDQLLALEVQNVREMLARLQSVDLIAD